MNIPTSVKKEYGYFKRKWQLMNKPREDCTIKELQEKINLAEGLSKSYAGTTFLILGFLVYLFYEGKTSIMYSTLLIISMIAYMTMNNTISNLKLFKYHKYKEYLK
jgi:hypothetical protein